MDGIEQSTELGLEFPLFPGIEMTKRPYADLETRLLGIPGWTHQVLGQSVQGRNIHGFSLGEASKPCLYIEGNIHGGHEWRTPYWVSEFMKVLARPGTIPQAPWLEYLTSRYRFYVIPSVNPDGYENGTYQNANGVNLNRNCDFDWMNGSSGDPLSDKYRGTAPFSEPETQIVRDRVTALQPLSFLCCHTWGTGGNGFCVIASTNRDWSHALKTVLYPNLRRWLAHGSDRGTEYQALLGGGLAADWAGTQPSRQGGRIYSQVLETGGSNTAVDQSRMGMSGILAHCLTVDHVHTSRTLSP